MPTYKAIRIRQTTADRSLILFGAPAVEISDWAGIPQKKSIGGEETTGFQRDDNPDRVRSLCEFYSNEANIIQNPLLCAQRVAGEGRVEFKPDGGADGRTETGSIVIESPDFPSRSLLDLLRLVKKDIEGRLPQLATKQVAPAVIARLRRKAEQEHSVAFAPETSASSAESSTDVADDVDDDPTSIIFTDESHILDFWEEVAARAQILAELGTAFIEEKFLGYSKDAMISFLQPVVVVDGQHRLRGALEHAKSAASQEPYRSEIQKDIEKGTDPASAQRRAERMASRFLPISLLLTKDPAEHVFQFVVVNQKATPIGRALLGTIVSTSLSNEELERVSRRLEDAGIPLQDSRTVAYLTRHKDSPFFNLVEKGLTSESKDLLPWTVLVSLVRIFRELKGGKLFHEKNDYAEIFRRKYLEASPIVYSKPPEFPSAHEFWRSPNGPWRDVFIAFWSSTRDHLATTKDPQSQAYWGSARESNVFNKISLTILASDFFKFLCEGKRTIESVDAVPALVAEWLTDIDKDYFNRDWNLGGIKKDNTGIRNRWAKVWAEYRVDPKELPDRRNYRKPMNTD